MSEIWFKVIQWGWGNGLGVDKNPVGNELVKLSGEEVGIYTILSTSVYVENFQKSNILF